MEKITLVSNGGSRERCEHETKTTNVMNICSEGCTDYKGSNSAGGKSDCA